MGNFRKLILSLSILLSVSAFAQNEVADSVAVAMMSDTASTLVLPELFSAYDSTYSFIKFSEDTLYVAKNAENIAVFYAKLADVYEKKQGNVHIIHIGGSHVQAGTMSHRIRRHLLKDFGMEPASRGFIFPYSAANACNNPRDYTVTRSAPFSLIRNVYSSYPSPLGASGISVYCTSSLHSLQIAMNDPDFGFSSDTIVLFGRSNGNFVDPILKYDTIYRFADSTDYKNERFYYFLDRKISKFSFYFPCAAADTFFVNGIWLQNGNPGVTFSSIGVNGAAVPSYLRCENFSRDLSAFPPDLVIFGIGVNDAFDPNFDSTTFKNNYLALIDKFRAVNPDCAFVFLSNNDTWKRAARGKYVVNKTGPEVSETMYRLADSVGGASWDQFSVMGGLGSMSKWQAKNLAQKDRVHFTVNGYNLIGDLFYHAFIQYLKSDRR